MSLTSPYCRSHGQLASIRAHLWEEATNPSTIEAGDLRYSFIVSTFKNKDCRRIFMADDISIREISSTMKDYNDK